MRIAIVAGEESGDILGADLVSALERQSGRKVELVGVGGRNLQALGLKSLFRSEEIALMGVSAIIRDLPRLLRRIRQTASAIVEARPECLITIDSPEFALRVARRVHEARPDLPIVHYVCPSVWAWRPGRAAQMKPYVDHILCLLPFEPKVLRELDGPAGTYVGHRLNADSNLLAAAHEQLARPPKVHSARKNLLVLPGSRRGEVTKLLKPFGQTVKQLADRGHEFELLLPTVPHVEKLVEQGTRDWVVAPRIILDEQEKWRAFAQADAALACSGTVALELALARIPFASCYKTDPLARMLISMITVWSASLPNLIAGWPVVPEFFDDFVRPEYLARLTEQLWEDTPTRQAQREGFAQVAAALSTPEPSGELAAKAVLNLLSR
ncbi:lipid-A-disaccharide synthase [Nitratireductor basaltis]|uniref:Lipid-A-disaccharide synthase n=1 Tax=Nitratireductor basaltis TaxID=472175 RepID=A0A084UB44_9HYPH|nr:Lipid-A-disaccharide synthase [Nitratireductor basaltis]